MEALVAGEGGVYVEPTVIDTLRQPRKPSEYQYRGTHHLKASPCNEQQNICPRPQFPLSFIPQTTQKYNRNPIEKVKNHLRPSGIPPNFLQNLLT